MRYYPECPVAGSLPCLNSTAHQGRKPTLSSREIRAAQKHSNFDFFFFFFKSCQIQYPETGPLTGLVRCVRASDSASWSKLGPPKTPDVIWMKPQVSNVLFDLDLLDAAREAMFRALNSSRVLKLVSGFISKSGPPFAVCCVH